MAWTVFELVINLFQSSLILFYLKHCFSYEKKVLLADTSFLAIFTAFLTLSQGVASMPFFVQQIIFFSLVFCRASFFSSEPKFSIVYWILILSLVFNLVSVLTYPVFDLFPLILGVTYPNYAFKRILCIIITNILLFFVLKLIIRLKKKCSFPKPSAYAIFICTLAVIYIVEEALYSLYNQYGSQSALPFFIAYIGLLFCVILLITLFHTVSNDTERENRYQAEISLLTLSKQHQRELSQMYEDLTTRQHDYKQHLQMLRELVSNDKDSTAEKYLNSVISDNLSDEMIVTGSPEIDALLTAKRRIMRERGIEFIYVPYPLASLPIHVLDFCTIVGNLLDNAIEGVGRIKPAPASPSIRLAFSRSWDMFYIYCENPCDTSTIIKEKDHFVSSKQKTEPGMHGIGMHSINAIADRDEGRVEFYIEGNTFYAKVVLPYLNERGKYQ